MSNKIIEKASFSSGVASMILEEGVPFPSVGETLTSNGAEAKVMNVNQETREVKILVTKFADFDEELKRYKNKANDCVFQVAQKILEYENDKISWVSLSEEEQDGYIDKSIEILLLLQENDLLRFSPLLL